MRGTLALGVMSASLMLFSTAGCQHSGSSSSSTSTDHPTAMSAAEAHAGMHASTGSGAAARLLPKLGDMHHPVSTNNAEAQRFFDQGLTLCYAFNHDEAIRSFRRAAELDPRLAMAWWGVAYALGPNYNDDITPEREKAAHEAIHKALELSAAAPEPERAYVRAMAKRYTSAPKADLHKLSADFSSAMRDLSKRYPDDLDAATIFAESAMDLRPWHLWSPDGKPAEGTEEIVATLESVLKRNPNHIGALHLYIHAVEASPHPEYALQAADVLPGLCPAAGHLVHMPAHIYARTGDYEAAASSNDAAVAADRSYMKLAAPPPGIYTAMYYSHNLHFLAYASAEAGRYIDAKQAAEQLAAHVGPQVPAMPMLEGFMPVPVMTLVRFHKWDEVLRQPDPGPSMATTRMMWHLARGMAFAAKGDTAAAENERSAFEAARNAVPPDAPFSPWNKAADVLAVGSAVLESKLAAARRDPKAAADALTRAVAAQDKLSYGEPPDWLLPTREMLGAVLLRQGNAAEAERVFRAELAKNPRSGRALFGLEQCLRAQGRAYDADQIHTQFDAAWKHADTKLRTDDL